MNDVNPDLVEKYQLMLQKDPRSRVFAPLVEAYRKMGLLDEALEEGLKGVRYHPDFAGGRIALAKVLMERIQYDEAIEQLEYAVRLSSENILGYTLLAECCIRVKHPKKALSAYKMVLFLNPKDSKAQIAVKKLESLTADEYDDDIFAMRPLKNLDLEQELELKPLEGEREKQSNTDLERLISLTDAYIVRNDFEKAYETLQLAERYNPGHPDVTKRFRLLNQMGSEDEDEGIKAASQKENKTPEESIEQSPSRESMVRERKVQYLKMLVARIADRSQEY